ncbi:MAG: hypothetical protein ABIH20_06370 [Candidatus Diapherotrites archaeon]
MAGKKRVYNGAETRSGTKKHWVIHATPEQRRLLREIEYIARSSESLTQVQSALKSLNLLWFGHKFPDSAMVRLTARLVQKHARLDK